MRYYKLNEAELKKELETDFDNGLSSSQVDKRFKECGYNTTYSKPALSFKSVNAIFLAVSSIITLVYLIVGVFNLKNGFDYFFLAITSALIFIFSQLITSVFDYLIDRDMYFSSLEKTDTLSVLRNGEKINVKYSEIVYGDIVYLNKGDYIPFDGVIVSSNGLVTDESELSGSDRASKHVGIITDDNVAMSGLFNSVFCGSFVIHGKAKVVVTDVCSRVYLVKSGLKQSKKSKHSFKNVDVATLFLTVLSALCICFSIVCGLISKEYIGIFTSTVFFIAFVLSGFTRVFAKHSFKKIFLNLKKKNIFLKSFDELETLSNTDVMLLEHETIFDDKIEICGFLTESLERKSVLDISKNNFATFLYAALCLDESAPLFKSCRKLLKKIGIDYDEVSSLCPMLSKSATNVNGVKICARAYDGSNLLIAVGSHVYIKNMCTGSFDEQKILSLDSESTEMISVAIKKVDVVSDDLLSQLNDFSFVGVIGINRKISANSSRKVKNLNKLGIHPLILFPGNKQAAISTFGENVHLIDSREFLMLDSKAVSSADIIYNYTGDKTEIVAFISSLGLIPGYFGDKLLRDKKCISFKSNLMSRYETRDADVVCPTSFSSVYTVFNEAKKSTYFVRNAFENIALCLLFYCMCGILFALLFKELLVSTLTASLLLLVVVPSLLYFKLYMGIADREMMTYGIGRDILSKKNIMYVGVTVVAFLLTAVLTRFFVASDVSSAFLILMFITYLVFSVYDIKKAPIRCALGMIIPITVAILFIMPFSFVFGNLSGGVFMVILSILVGMLLKIAITVLCRLVKN